MRSASGEYRRGEIAMKVTGRCHCGQISFEAEIDPAQVRICHCTDCQTLTGTASRTTVPSLPSSFVLKSGTPKIYIKTAEAGTSGCMRSALSAAHRSMRRPRAPTRRPMVCGWAPSTAAPNCVRRGRAGAARRCPGRWTSAVSSASSASHSTRQNRHCEIATTERAGFGSLLPT